MLLPEILLLAGLALLFRGVSHWPRTAWLRGWLVFAASVVCLYWLQPATPIRYLDFWLPTATLALTMLGWLLTGQAAPVPVKAAPGDAAVPVPTAPRFRRADLVAAGLLAVLVLLVGLTRYLGGGDWLAAARPPAVEQVLLALAVLALLLGGFAWALRRRLATPAALLAAAITLLIVLLVVLKTPELSLLAARGLRGMMGQKASLATALDIRWLGFSYICFRLIHTLRDRQTGRLPAADLQTYLSYVVFFPSLVAGPIDRLERFQRDFCAPVSAKAGDQITEAGRRLALGLFKKFVVADTLALVALNPQNAGQVQAAGWLWLLVYLYAFQIYFDFSGYTDIAIGLGLLLGIKLPENFNAPYLKPNLTQFWNSWHMSLTQWFRGYFFNPFVRWLRGPKVKAGPVVVLLLSQVCTMLLIGLWHGITANFVIWGLWHGFGMFAQNRWTDLVRPWFAARTFSPPVQRGLQIAGTLLTFHYVALGWVWFVLPTPALAGDVLLRLIGVVR